MGVGYSPLSPLYKDDMISDEINFWKFCKSFLILKIQL